MNDLSYPRGAAATWCGEPQLLVHAMRQDSLLMLRTEDGPYLLIDQQRTGIPMIVPEDAVNFLLERGWLTRVDEHRVRREALFLLTAEGRRTSLDTRRAGQ